jgi:hypothetical protein
MDSLLNTLEIVLDWVRNYKNNSNLHAMIIDTSVKVDSYLDGKIVYSRLALGQNYL